MWLKITLSRLSTRGRTAACSLPHLPLITEEKFNVNRRGGWARQLRRHWFSGATNGPIRMRDGLLLDSHWPVDSSRRGQSCFQPFFFFLCCPHIPTSPGIKIIRLLCLPRRREEFPRESKRFFLAHPPPQFKIRTLIRTTADTKQKRRNLILFL